MTNVPAVLQSDREVNLAARIVGRELEPAEFDHFVHMCRTWGLDPLRKHIYAIVVTGKRGRTVTYVTGIDGYRTIAARSGDYRPGKRTVEVDQNAIDPTSNPHGIISATASAWKFSHGSWHEIEETVYWDEYAPLRDEWKDNKPTGRKQLDTRGQWGKMGRTMLQKCAEAQVLRRGWPDELSGLYVAEEMHQAQAGDDAIDITPHEQVERAEIADRTARAGGPSILIDWCNGEDLEAVPVGQFADRVIAYADERRKADDVERVVFFVKRNRDGLRQFWQQNKTDALALKQQLAEITKGAEND